MPTSPTFFVLPDLYAGIPFEGSLNPNYPEVAAESSQWIHSGNLIPVEKLAFFKQAGAELLTAHTYPYADRERFRTTCDFINLLFALDEISDDQDGRGARTTGLTFYNAMHDPNYDDGSTFCKMMKEFTARFLQRCGPLTFNRFVNDCKSYVDAVSREADLRQHETVLDLPSFIELRRNYSATLPCLCITNYAIDIDLPDEVIEHPTFRVMRLSAADLIWLANDLYSYNREQAMGHSTSNILTVLMCHKGLDLQEAADYVAVHFKGLLNAFLEAKMSMPSWGTKIDHDVAQYAMAMETWVIGNLNWCFESQRYFGDAGREVKRTGVVHMYPRRAEGISNDEE